mmetsp:Transcript_9477/g.20039  ORF Transcript_9477/g.20039 Transcript_9477/m.20039 type:complete len:286 (+) Transcript_9477:113-970(+)
MLLHSTRLIRLTHLVPPTTLTKFANKYCRGPVIWIHGDNFTSGKPKFSKHLSHQYLIYIRTFSSTPSKEDNPDQNSQQEQQHLHQNLDHKQDHQQELPTLLYEGPFASLTLKLKRISLTSAAIGLIGLPAISLFYGAGSVPASGQIAVIATAGITAVGSTALLGYCFSPYVQRLERLPDDANDPNATKDDDDASNKNLLRITTRDIFARKIETVFDPATDVSPPPSNNSRPFCNFMVKGMPMYVHPELLQDRELRVKLVGEDPEMTEEGEITVEKKKKLEDDDIF